MDRRTLYTDIDDTLLCHNLSDFPKQDRIVVTCNGRTFEGVPHAANIRLLIKFWKLGYEVIAWSKTGKSWAQAVVDALQLGDYVSICLSKPDFIMDDKGVETWIGPRVYRDPKTGVEA